MKADPVSPLVPPVPLAEQAYHEIMSRLSAGDPDQRLVERELAEALSMSRTPVREALRRLAAESVVEGTPGRGYVVRRFVRRDVCDYYDLRLLFEPEAVVLGANRLPGSRGEDAGRLQAAVESSSFHMAVAAASGNAALMAVIGVLVDHPVGRLLTEDCAGATNEKEAGHARILGRMRDGDASGAAERMREHLEILRRSCVEALRPGDPHEESP